MAACSLRSSVRDSPELSISIHIDVLLAYRAYLTNQSAYQVALCVAASNAVHNLDFNCNVINFAVLALAVPHIIAMPWTLHMHVEQT